MTILPKILQVQFCRSNRLYTPVIHDKKLYGIFLDGQFHDRETVTSGVDLIFVVLIILPFLIVVLPLLIWLLSQTGFPIRLDYALFLGFDAVFGGIYLYNLYRLTPIYKNISIKIYNYFDLKFDISAKALAKEKLGLEQIKQASDIEFLKSNPKNFITDLGALDKIEISPKNSLIMWPGTHFGQIKLILKPNNKFSRHQFFALKEPKYAEIVTILNSAQIELEYIQKFWLFKGNSAQNALSLKIPHRVPWWQSLFFKTKIPPANPTQTICNRIKLKPNSLARVTAWANEINSRSSEAFQTLLEEGVMVECAFLEQAVDGDYLIYLIKAENLAKMSQVAAVSTHPIDIFHKEFKAECFDGGSTLETLIDLDRYSLEPEL